MDRDSAWLRQLVAAMDKNLERVYIADPLTYAELFKIRQRVARRIAADERVDERVAA
jgi:hypothetical protein